MLRTNSSRSTATLYASVFSCSWPIGIRFCSFENRENVYPLNEIRSRFPRYVTLIVPASRRFKNFRHYVIRSIHNEHDDHNVSFAAAPITFFLHLVAHQSFARSIDVPVSSWSRSLSSSSSPSLLIKAAKCNGIFTRRSIEAVRVFGKSLGISELNFYR